MKFHNTDPWSGLPPVYVGDQQVYILTFVRTTRALFSFAQSRHTRMAVFRLNGARRTTGLVAALSLQRYQYVHAAAAICIGFEQPL